jgi:predicted LPLAT superfamily acyltransferase/glycosyltransferase involved in cell wall biosynthesis
VVSEPLNRRRSCDQAKACVVIPVYNHVRTLSEVVRGALAHASTVIVCDDGSTDGSGDAAEAAGAIVLRHPANQGKGAALQSLLREAEEQGFRYAIAMDADGQHLPEDLPKLAEAAVEHPGAVVLGSRSLVAAGAPASSEFGRKFSNFWVWFESGIRVDDSQSGFRAYPLPETSQLRVWSRGYEFEVEVLLRAGWAGIPVETVSIQVLYPADRVTHFRLFADNVRISLLNTVTCLRLLLPLPLGRRLRWIPRRPGLSLFSLRRWVWLGGEGPVWRVVAATAGVVFSLRELGLPLRALLAAGCVLGGLGAFPAWVASVAFTALVQRGLRPTAASALIVGAFALFGIVEALRLPKKATAWTGRSRGGVFGHWFFFQVTRVFGLSPAYWVLFPVCFYFFLTARVARTASMQFLERAIGPVSFVKRLGRTYFHLLSFSRTLVDRAFFGIRGKEAFHYEPNGLDYIQSAAAAGGVVLLTAHMGNWEIASGLLGEAGKKLAIVGYRREHENLSRYLEKAQGPRPRIIEVGSDTLSSLEMVRALREGAVLALHGDRAVDRNVVRVPFLGRDAPFPIGPFMLAAVSGAPLIATFSLQVAPATYRLFARPPVMLRFEPGHSRESQLQSWVEQYVLELEAVARQYPYQWFNFYDFWDAPPPPPAAQLTPTPSKQDAESGDGARAAGRLPPRAGPG